MSKNLQYQNHIKVTLHININSIPTSVTCIHSDTKTLWKDSGDVICETPPCYVCNALDASFAQKLQNLQQQQQQQFGAWQRSKHIQDMQHAKSASCAHHKVQGGSPWNIAIPKCKQKWVNKSITLDNEKTGIPVNYAPNCPHSWIHHFQEQAILKESFWHSNFKARKIGEEE